MLTLLQFTKSIYLYNVRKVYKTFLKNTWKTYHESCLWGHTCIWTCWSHTMGLGKLPFCLSNHFKIHEILYLKLHPLSGITNQCYYNTSKGVKQISNPSCQHLAVWQFSPKGRINLIHYLSSSLPLFTVSIDKPWLQPVLICLFVLTRQGIFCWKPLFYNHV